jgi:lipopolysaccharide transport system permease protein
VAYQNPKATSVTGHFELVIEPGRGFRNYWQDIWHYRELLYFLSWRDILVRYKQTVIGVAWAILRPLLAMAIFTAIFGYLAKLPSEGVPYPLLVYTAMLPWQFFSSSLSECSNSFITNANMLTKIYFPRLVVPASAVIVNLVDFLISFIILGALMAWYRFAPGWQIITLPLFLSLSFFASFGFGLWMATLNVKYRDFRYVVPFIVQFGLYVSPVGFSSSVVPGKWRLFYSLNPMVGIIDGFRWAILGGESQFYWPGFLLSLVITSVMLLLAFRYFRNTERNFADII